MSNFSDLAKAAVAANVLDTGKRAETVTYLPDGGEGRSIVALVESDADLRELEDGVDHEETINVTVGRDPDAATGGVEEPAEGDRVQRADGREYEWTGREEERISTWRLEFKRQTPSVVGTEVLP